MSFRFTVAITLLALGLLRVFYIGAIPHVDAERFAFAIDADPGASR